MNKKKLLLSLSLLLSPVLAFGADCPIKLGGILRG